MGTWEAFFLHLYLSLEWVSWPVEWGVDKSDGDVMLLEHLACLVHWYIRSGGIVYRHRLCEVSTQWVESGGVATTESTFPILWYFHQLATKEMNRMGLQHFFDMQDLDLDSLTHLCSNSFTGLEDMRSFSDQWGEQHWLARDGLERRKGPSMISFAE